MRNSNEIVFNEGFSFKTKEEAERALEKVKNNEKKLEDYINVLFKAFSTGFILGMVTGPIGPFLAPWSVLLINATGTWLAFPGSAGDKLNKCNKIIKKCDNTIDKLSKNNDSDSKKVIEEIKKVKKQAESEKQKHEKRVKQIGNYASNYHENAIFNDIEFI